MIYNNIYIIINYNDSLYLYNPLLQTKKTKMQKCKNANICAKILHYRLFCLSLQQINV